MGVKINITHNTFPKQGELLGKKVRVCFHYDASNLIEGEIVRDDYEHPYKMIIKLVDGRYILSTECMYTY